MPKTSKTTQQHIYRDELGNKLYRKDITKYLDGGKEPHWFYYQKGKLKPNTGPEGLKWVNRNKPLYNLPSLYKTRKSNKPIFIVEGEKCVEALRELGLIATCHCIGSSGEWRKEYGAWMKRRPVFVFTDNDNPGIEHAHRMAKGASAVASEVRIISPWKDKPEHYDVADWIEEHLDKSNDWLVKQLRKFAEQASAYTLQDSLPYQTYDLIEVENFKNPEFQIDKILPAGCFTILYSPTKTGKSFLALSWAAAVQAGNSWLNSYDVQQGQVVYVIAEGGQGDWKLRIKALQKGYRQAKTREQLNKMQVIFDQPLLDTRDIDKLIEVLEKVNPLPALVILDTKARTSSGSETSGQDTNLYVHAVDRIRAQFNCSVLVVDHTPLADVTRTRGHSGLMAAADMLIRIEKPEKGPGLAKIICENARSCEPFEDICIEFISERIGEDLTSLRVVPGDKSEWKSEKVKAINKNTEKIIEVLTEQPGLSSKKLKEETGLKRVFYSVIKYMTENNLVENRGETSRPKWYLLQ